MKKSKNKLILEFTEFNLQRFSANSPSGYPNVDDPSLSLNAFDKHQDSIRQATARINDILKNIKGTTSYSDLRSKLSLEHQDIQSMRILRILKSNSVNYDVYVVIEIYDNEYWGVVHGINTYNSEFKSEVFSDTDLHQPKEWVIKIKGLVIDAIKQWLMPEPGNYRLLKDFIYCYSVDTGNKLKMNIGTEIELIRSHDTKIIVKHENHYYNLVGDNYMYFNWWFEKI
jgi:hypothetical protein